jgi:hypothetical protein
MAGARRHSAAPGHHPGADMDDLSTPSPWQATRFIIPRRAFADDGDAQRFAEFVRSKTRKSN